MAVQLNVAQQNTKTTAAVRRAAALLAGQPEEMAWFVALLESHSLQVTSGMLARLSKILEQEGNWFGGVWLTQGLEFWEFAAVVSWSNGELLEVEQFENVTQSVEVNAHVPGTGKSFGYIAIEVLRELRGA